MGQTLYEAELDIGMVQIAVGVQWHVGDLFAWANVRTGAGSPLSSATST